MREIVSDSIRSKIIDMYHDHSCKEIKEALDLNLSYKQIKGIAQRAGSRKDLEMLERHVEDSQYELELSIDQIRNLDHRPGAIGPKRKTSLDDNYFDTIDNSEKAYWLGFLYADGYIYERLNKNGEYSRRFELGLATTDEVHLHKFRYCIGSNKKLTRKKSHINGKEFSSVKLAIYGKKFSDDLVSKGVVPRKSLVLTFPNTDVLPEKYYSHFIRGYFDGDGCVSGNNDTYTYAVNFVGTFNFLAAIENIFHNEIGLNYVVVRKKGRAYQINYGGYHNFTKIYDYLYKDSCVSLDRKRKHFQQIINSKKYLHPKQTA